MGDFNEDGKLDLVIFEMDGADFPAPDSEPVHQLVAVYLQSASGEFTCVTDAAIVPVENVLRDFLPADFNEDGHLDLLVNDRGVGMIMLFGLGNGKFQEPKKLGLDALTFAAIADLNGDHHIDMVAATAENGARVFLGAGDGTFTPGAALDTLTNPIGERRGQIMLGDVNHDGKLDIAVASVLDFTTTWTGNLDVFFGRGDGTFDNPIRTPNVGTWRGALSDLNGDGILDYIGDRYNPAAVEVWLGQSDGAFKKRGSYSMSGYQPNWITTGDLNGDGLLDVIVSNMTEAAEPKPAPLAIFLGKGDGTFQSRKLHNPLGNMGHGDLGPTLIDLNGDGLEDIAAVAHSSDFVTNILAINLAASPKSDQTLGFHLTVQNTSSGTAILESTSNLTAWTPVTTNSPAGDWSLVVPSGTNARFYRTRRP